MEQKKHPQTLLTQQILKKKINKRCTGKSWKQYEFEPCYTCEKTSQLSYKSRVLHSIWLCALAGVNTRGGAPTILTILLISVHMSTKICNWRWILHLCSYQDFNSKSMYVVVRTVYSELCQYSFNSSCV